ncbi:MAG: prepilin-type N-terminal cleavage/methylation domain-containing protein [Rubrivivax sp.]
MRHLSTRQPCGPARPAARRGLTLIELMLAITIAAFLVVAAAPHFADYTNNSRLREGSTTLQTEALYAQSEAIKRNRVVRLTTSGSQVQVLLEAQDTAAMTLLRERARRRRHRSHGDRGLHATRLPGQPGRGAFGGLRCRIGGPVAARRHLLLGAALPGLRVDAGRNQSMHQQALMLKRRRAATPARPSRRRGAAAACSTAS